MGAEMCIRDRSEDKVQELKTFVHTGRRFATKLKDEAHGRMVGTQLRSGDVDMTEVNRWMKSAQGMIDSVDGALARVAPEVE